MQTLRIFISSPVDVQLIDLILHQRDQRRDHDGQPLTHEGRELIAEAFSRAGGKDGDGIKSAEGGGHDVFLKRAEAVVTKHLSQQGGETGGGRGRGIGVHVGVGWWIWMSLYQLPESRSNEQFGEGGFF